MKFFILLSAVAFASCGPVVKEDQSVMRMVIGNFVDCMNSDLSLCLKEHALKATERISGVRQLKLAEGVTIFNNGGAKESKSLELSAEPQVREKQITERLWESATDLLRNSDLELSFAGPEDEQESRALDEVDEGRGKKKKQIKKKLKILVPLLILAKVKAVALVVLSLVVIAASVFKLAVLAKIAFIAKVIAIIKALLQKKHEQEEAWIPHHEEHAHVQQGWDQGGGWSRRQNDANNLAYSAYAN